MKYFLLTIFLLIFLIQTYSQEVRLIDAKTGQPVEGVLLLSGNITAQSNENGFVSLNYFPDTGLILFQHSSFLPYSSTKEKILQQGKIILMMEDPVKLDEIIISANRWEQPRTEISNKIETLDATDLERYNPQTTADLVEETGGVFVQKSQMGGGSPMIRGFSANRILLVLDGIRMNNAIYRSGNLHNIISIDGQSVENIEIIFGPGSVIYGSDAMGGVISFNTLKPKLSAGSESFSSGRIFTRFSTANFEKTIHGTFNTGSEKWGAVLSTTFTGFDNLRMGSFGRPDYLRTEFVADRPFEGTDHIVKNKNPLRQYYTAYHQFNLLGKFRYRPSEKTEVNFGINHSATSAIPRYDRLIVYQNDKLRYGQWYYGPQNWSLINASLNHKTNCTLFDKIHLITGYQSYTESRYDRLLNVPSLNGRKENVYVYSLNIDLGKTIDKFQELYFGFESYINRINSSGTTKNLENGNVLAIPSRYPDDSNYGNTGIYLSYKHNTHKKFIFQTGARLTYTWLNGKFNPEYYHFPFEGFNIRNASLTGNLGVIWQPEKEWKFSMTLSTGFRSPNMDDAAKVFDSEPGNVVVPNPDLQPEYARNAEIGLVRLFSGKAKVEMNFFYTVLKNAIVRRDFLLNGRDSVIYDGLLSKVEAMVNAESAEIYGSTFLFQYLFSNYLRIKSDLSLTSGKDSDGYPVRHAPPAFGSTHLIYENPKWFIDLHASYSNKVTFRKLAPSEREKPYLYAIDREGNPWSPAWWTLNVKATRQVNKTVKISGGIENILDKRYRSYSSGIVAPGINFILSLGVLI